jgi:hypothetical protein
VAMAEFDLLENAADAENCFSFWPRFVRVLSSLNTNYQKAFQLNPKFTASKEKMEKL